MQNTAQIVQLERELAHLLLTISRMETNIEEYRINLSENDKFNAEDAFEQIDHNGHGYLLISDFTSFFSANHMPVLERECYYIFNFYCNEVGKRMEFGDFLKMIAPVTNIEVRDRFLRRAATRKKRMPFFLVDQLAQLIQKELDFFLKTETLKMNLMHTYGWNTVKAFSLIDRMAKGYIDYKDVVKLIEKIGESFTEDDYKALARRLDRDFNEKITKNEFCDALLPNDVSREDVETHQVKFLDKSPDFFYNPAKTTIGVQDNQLTQKRKYLTQNVNLVNQDYDNVFSAEEELKYIKPFLRNPNDVMAFANENFYKQAKSVRARSPPERNENYVNDYRPLMPTVTKEPFNPRLAQTTTQLYKSDVHPPTNQKLMTSLLRSSNKKKIFDDYNNTISPKQRDVEKLKMSVHDIVNMSMRNSSAQRFTTNANNMNASPSNSKLDYLFRKN